MHESCTNFTALLRQRLVATRVVISIIDFWSIPHDRAHVDLRRTYIYMYVVQRVLRGREERKSQHWKIMRRERFLNVFTRVWIFTISVEKFLCLQFPTRRVMWNHLWKKQTHDHQNRSFACKVRPDDLSLQTYKISFKWFAISQCYWYNYIRSSL